MSIDRAHPWFPEETTPTRRLSNHRWLHAALAALVLVACVSAVREINARLGSTEVVDSALVQPTFQPELWNDWLHQIEVHSEVPADEENAPLWARALCLAEDAPDEVVEEAPVAKFIAVDITGYSSRVEETDSDPFITAMCTVTAPGVIALSRDLLRTFTPGAPLDFGDKVLIPGVGVYRVEDTMNKRWRHRADIWFESTRAALQWGHQTAYLVQVDDSTPLFPFEPPMAWNQSSEDIDRRHHSGLSTPSSILR